MIAGRVENAAADSQTALMCAGAWPVDDAANPEVVYLRMTSALRHASDVRSWHRLGKRRSMAIGPVRGPLTGGRAEYLEGRRFGSAERCLAYHLRQRAGVKGRAVEAHKIVDHGWSLVEVQASRRNEVFRVNPVVKRETDLAVVVARPIGQAVNCRKSGVEVERQLPGGTIVIDADLAGVDAMPLKAFVHDLSERQGAANLKTGGRPLVRLPATHDAIGVTQYRLDIGSGKLRRRIQDAILPSRSVKSIGRRSAGFRAKEHWTIRLPMDPHEFGILRQLDRKQSFREPGLPAP